MTFYQRVFGWKYYTVDTYYIAYIETIEAAGLYETPDQFNSQNGGKQIVTDGNRILLSDPSNKAFFYIKKI